MTVLGAIAGDIIGSPYERGQASTKEFELFGPRCRFTDDTVLTLAVAESLLDGEDVAQYLREYYARYPGAGYGGAFHSWARNPLQGPYQSFGNGAAMRVSPVAYVAKSLDEALQLARKVTAVTHDHPEGIRGAEAIAGAIFLAREGRSPAEVCDEVSRRCGYDLDFALEEYRPRHGFDVTCQGTVPQALVCFREADNFEGAVRNACWLGGDSDTLACIAGSVAAAAHGLPPEIAQEALRRLDADLADLLRQWMDEVEGRAR